MFQSIVAMEPVDFQEKICAEDLYHLFNRALLQNIVSPIGLFCRCCCHGVCRFTQKICAEDLYLYT